MNQSPYLLTTMTVLTEEQFEEFIEEFPEMEQFYDLEIDAKNHINDYLWN